MEKIRWGLLSTANINQKVIPGIQASERGVLAAVASRDLAKAKAYASKWNIPRAFGSYEEMLNSGEVDAVYISLPNHLHAEWSIQALHSGIHVLCEKPFSLSDSETLRMIQASQETGKVLQEAFMYRHHPQTLKAKAMVEAGDLGEITLIQGTFSFYMEQRAKNIRLDPAIGGGSMWDVGVYPMSFAQYIYGRPPQQVSAVQWIGDTGVDDTFSGQLDYGSGQAAQIASSFNIPFYTSIIIHGTSGRLELTRPFTNINDGQMLFTSVKGDTQPIEVPVMDSYQAEVENMHAAILDGAPILVSLEESRNHIRTALALYTAARTGEIVPI